MRMKQRSCKIRVFFYSYFICSSKIAAWNICNILCVLINLQHTQCNTQSLSECPHYCDMHAVYEYNTDFISAKARNSFASHSRHLFGCAAHMLHALSTTTLQKAVLSALTKLSDQIPTCTTCPFVQACSTCYFNLSKFIIFVCARNYCT